MREGGLRTKGFTRESSEDFPLISIVMVTRNAAEHFRQALASVCNQDYPNKEIVVVDGGSTDATIDIIAEFSARIDYWISEPDKGIYDAMNKGILLSRGDWIGFKNADDWYTEDSLSVLAVCIREHPEVDVWYGNSYSVIQENPLKLAPYFTAHQNLGRNPGIDHRSSFVRSRAQKEFLFDLNFRLAADLDVFWRLKKSGGQFRHTGAFMAYKRFGGASDGTHIEKETFQINRRHGGIFYAIHAFLLNRFSFFIWQTGNLILRFILGERMYYRFKSRRIKQR
jgi:glycosyltransferase involved in cell wall biosynthesis